jgi:hypothetical protein
VGRVRSILSLINFYIFIFFINFIFLIKNLFNIIKFELKIYSFTLNNVIKPSLYYFFQVVPCRAGLIGPTIGPSRVGGEARAWPDVGLGPARPAIFHARPCSCWTNSVVLRASPFSLARMARYSDKWSGKALGCKADSTRLAITRSNSIIGTELPL